MKERFKEKSCKQCRQVKFIRTMTKWPVQKHTEQKQYFKRLYLCGIFNTPLSSVSCVSTLHVYQWTADYMLSNCYK